MPRTKWLERFFESSPSSTTFRAHSYKYRCAKWYGWAEGARTIILEPGADVKQELHRDARTTARSGDCSVTLLQVYNVTIGNIRPYAALGVGVQPPAVAPRSAGAESS